MKINYRRIEVLAAQQGMNLGQLAEKAEISRQTLSNIKLRGTCRTDTAVRLYNAIGLDTNELIEEDFNE